MTRASRLVLAALLLATSPGASLSAPVDLSSGQDAAIRQLISESDAVTPARQAGGNPFLKKAAKAAPKPKATTDGEPSGDQPIDLLSHDGGAAATKAEASPALPAAKPAVAKSPKKAAAPAASPAKVAKAAPMPLPRRRPAITPPAPPQVEPLKPVVADAPAVAAAKPQPVVVAEAAPVAPAAHPDTAQPAHPPSANAATLPVDTSNSVDLVAAPLPADAPPYRLMRSLQMLQDQTAQGSAAAFVAERQLRARLDEAFVKTEAKMWQDPLNAAAAVTFVLSGGSPAVLRHMASLAPAPAIDRNLIDGAIAYVEGRVGDAAKALADVDPTGLPASMAGQMALAQAALAVATDPERAMDLLDTARLLAPGTLVEEAALRREIVVVDQLGDEEKFQKLSRQYLSRFRHSVYAGNFRYRFASVLAHFRFADEGEQAKKLDDMFRDLDSDTARELYLTVARAAVVQGKATAAALAAERAAATSADGSADQARARLYRAAALAVLPDGLDNAIAEEQAIRPELLKPSDRILKEAAALTIEAIAKADKVADRTGGDPAVPKSATPSPAMIKAETALQAADALLKEASR